MYLSRAARILCLLDLIFLIPLVRVTVSMALSGSEHHLAGALVPFLVLDFLLAIPVLLLGRYLFSEARKRKLQKDVLAESLNLRMVAERRGVQWVLLPFPDRIVPPAVGILAFVLQNAHGRPREVQVQVLRSPWPTVKTLAHCRLEGGEVGVLRVLYRVPPGAAPGDHVVHLDLRVRLPEKVGPRVIVREGLSPRRFYYALRAEVKVAGSHGGTPLNESVLGEPVYRRLFITGDLEPELAELRALDQMISVPPAGPSAPPTPAAGPTPRPA